MKTTSFTLIARLIGTASPLFIAWLAAGQKFSPDAIFGCYAAAGIFLIGIRDYSPSLACADSKTVVPEPEAATVGFEDRSPLFNAVVKQERLAA